MKKLLFFVLIMTLLVGCNDKNQTQQNLSEQQPLNQQATEQEVAEPAITNEETVEKYIKDYNWAKENLFLRSGPNDVALSDSQTISYMLLSPKTAVVLVDTSKASEEIGGEYNPYMVVRMKEDGTVSCDEITSLSDDLIMGPFYHYGEFKFDSSKEAFVYTISNDDLELDAIAVFKIYDDEFDVIYADKCSFNDKKKYDEFLKNKNIQIKKFDLKDLASFLTKVDY